MCRSIGSHFHDWIDYNGVPFTIELLEWGGTFRIVGVGNVFIFTVSKCTRMLVLYVKKKGKVESSSFNLKNGSVQFRKTYLKDPGNYICLNLTKMGSIIYNRIDFNGVGALRGQRHVPSKN